MNRTQFRPPRRRDPHVRRRSIVYGFNILDPKTRDVRVDYVGQTVQDLSARERQHRGADLTVDAMEQPWSDLIVGKPFIVEEGWWTAAELDERELFHIRRLRPRYNYTGNLANPDRIPIFEARRQREERDRAAGRVSPTWTKTRGQIGVTGGRDWRAVLAAAWRSWRTLTAAQRRVVGLLTFWLLFAAVLWVTASPRFPGTSGLAAGLIGSSVPTLAGVFGRGPRRRRGRGHR